MDLKEVLSTFIIDEIINEKATLKDNEQLLEAGIIDSFGIIKLISFIEKHFEIKLDNDDLMPDNFKNIQTISNMILKKQKEAKA